MYLIRPNFSCKYSRCKIPTFRRVFVMSANKKRSSLFFGGIWFLVSSSTTMSIWRFCHRHGIKTVLCSSTDAQFRPKLQVFSRSLTLVLDGLPLGSSGLFCPWQFFSIHYHAVFPVHTPKFWNIFFTWNF